MAVNNSPLVSVILPFYNAPFLREAIVSILNQSFQDFELLLINNDSTDSSLNVAHSFTNNPKVRVIREDKRGVVYAANTGIVEARGIYIARMDADDVAMEDRLETQVNELESNEHLGVVSGLVEYLGSHENEGFIHYLNWLNSIKSNHEISLNRFVEFPIANPTMMFRKNLFQDFGKYADGDFPEDYEFFLRLQEHGVSMEKVDQVVLKWRDLSKRLTRTDVKYTQEAFFKIKAKYLAHWLKQNNPFHPKVYIWGAGRVSRRRSDYLLGYGIEIDKYIDVKQGKNVLHYEDIPNYDSCFIISYVANRGAREEIRDFLNAKNFTEGINYLIAS